MYYYAVFLKFEVIVLFLQILNYCGTFASGNIKVLSISIKK